MLCCSKCKSTIYSETVFHGCKIFNITATILPSDLVNKITCTSTHQMLCYSEVSAVESNCQAMIPSMPSAAAAIPRINGKQARIKYFILPKRFVLVHSWLGDAA